MARDVVILNVNVISGERGKRIRTLIEEKGRLKFSLQGTPMTFLESSA